METDGKEGAEGEKKDGDKADNEPEKSLLTESKYYSVLGEGEGDKADNEPEKSLLTESKYYSVLGEGGGGREEGGR